MKGVGAAEPAGWVGPDEAEVGGAGGGIVQRRDGNRGPVAAAENGIIALIARGVIGGDGVIVDFGIVAEMKGRRSDIADVNG